MILDTLENAARYDALHPLFEAAFDFLRRPDLNELAAGRHPIEGESLFAIVSHAPGRTRAEAPLESHRRYIDIQFVISGSDEMGWRSVSECRNPRSDYDEQRDIRFYDDPPAAWVSAAAGSFCIFFPEDAHAPLVGDTPIHKVVIKIAR